MINFTILKCPYHGKSKYAKIFAKLSKTKFVFKENWKCAHFFQRRMQSLNPMTGVIYGADSP